MEQPAQLVIQYGAYKAEIVLCPFQGLLTSTGPGKMLLNLHPVGWIAPFISW